MSREKGVVRVGTAAYDERRTDPSLRMVVRKKLTPIGDKLVAEMRPVCRPETYIAWHSVGSRAIQDSPATREVSSNGTRLSKFGRAEGRGLKPRTVQFLCGDRPPVIRRQRAQIRRIRGSGVGRKKSCESLWGVSDYEVSSTGSSRTLRQPRRWRSGFAHGRYFDPDSRNCQPSW